MKGQRYFPNTVAERPGWFENYALQLPVVNATLGLLAADMTNSLNDAGFCQYASGVWLNAVRDFGPAGTSALDDLYGGSGGGTFALPVFTVPTLPPAVGAVAPGALNRIFAFVQTIKASPKYTEAIGLQLKIVGAADTPAAGSNAPVFTLKTEHLGAAQESVRISFKKAGHQILRQRHPHR